MSVLTDALADHRSWTLHFQNPDMRVQILQNPTAGTIRVVAEPRSWTVSIRQSGSSTWFYACTVFRSSTTSSFLDDLGLAFGQEARDRMHQVENAVWAWALSMYPIALGASIELFRRSRGILIEGRKSPVQLPSSLDPVFEGTEHILSVSSPTAHQPVGICTTKMLLVGPTTMHARLELRACHTP